MKPNRPWSPSEVVKAGRKAIGVNKTYKRRVSINEDIIKTKFKHQAFKNEYRRKRPSRVIIQPPQRLVQPKPFVPTPKKEPINVQEELKNGALQLKQEVDTLLTLYGGTFSPQSTMGRGTMGMPSPSPDQQRRFVSPSPQASSRLDDEISKYMKHVFLLYCKAWLENFYLVHKFLELCVVTYYKIRNEGLIHILSL